MSKGLHQSRQSATVKLETFPYTRYGTVVAQVSVVSAEAGELAGRLKQPLRMWIL